MPDIVLMHRTTQSAAGFASLVDALERAGHRTVCLDVLNATATRRALQVGGMSRPRCRAPSAGLCWGGSLPRAD
ncbi:MAG: hypothetical protein M0T80_12310 [Actinomycetota bacterium]|nr:hypothetical protein [Actinomycetota bacterium]